MTMFVLVLFLKAGTFSKYDAYAITNVPGFSSQKQCDEAGKKAVAKFNEGYTSASFVCVLAGGPA